MLSQRSLNFRREPVSGLLLVCEIGSSKNNTRDIDQSHSQSHSNPEEGQEHVNFKENTRKWLPAFQEDEQAVICLQLSISYSSAFVYGVGSQTARDSIRRDAAQISG
jgi:hypothetical protein